MQNTYADSHKPIINFLPRTGGLLCISTEGNQPVLHPHQPTCEMLPARTNPGVGDTSEPSSQFHPTLQDKQQAGGLAEGTLPQALNA